jgi:DNA-binding transcriptional MerR regulator/effector-binding domain-containing protein
MFTIGEFSKITGLTVKTLRFYHEQQLLTPACVDEQTGYRYYSERQIEQARAIAYLRSLDFPLAEIAILLDAEDETQFIQAIERQRAAIEEKIRRYRGMVRSLDQFLAEEKENASMPRMSSFEVQEKTISPLLIAGVRMKGKYSDCGPAFSRIGRSFGRYICGKCFLLHYDDEYREDDADFEACMPIRQRKEADGISVRELVGGPCVSLLHKGPYDQLGRSYAKVFQYVRQHGYRALSPTREVYLKGPGMIFKGNPQNYLTEIQVFVANHAAA